MPTSIGLIRFIQLLPSVPVSSDFTLRDLPGSGKRIDILCRDLAACFDWGPTTWPKENLEFVALFEDKLAITIRFPSEKTPSGEVEWATVIADALRGVEYDFVSVEPTNLLNVILKLKNEPQGNLWILDESGNPLDDVLGPILSSQNSFMLGDHQGFDSRDLETFENQEIVSVSLGDLSYLSSHCVAAIISKMERRVA
ncbi:MAG: hypothetical protein JSW61_12795 [Candidatus Thorarchaeota archaeon]|nr:MAG: hypothetical protein JSW61_12795 [Candidatus Thorarchaeota archaeon]